MKALLHAKKTFIDTYGEVPPMIGFLGLDTDRNDFNKTLKSIDGSTEVALGTNEKMMLTVDEAEEFYEEHPTDFSWIPSCNIGALSMLRNNGAGGVRSNGRFAFTINYANVKAMIETKLSEISNAAIVDNDMYERNDFATAEIHIVFSICGGTGCGTFLNTAYLVRAINSDYKITGYAVLPGIFKGLPVTSRTIPNAFGALQDLDYLMHKRLGGETSTLKYLSDKRYVIKSRPFNTVMFIDNKNASGDTYKGVETLSQMIGLALVTAAGELADTGASIGDNFDVIISEKRMDILNKSGWAGGMGVCELVYRGGDLSDIYKYKAAENIIDRMFNPCVDANKIANDWIDAVKIRENLGFNHLTDEVCALNNAYSLNIERPSTARDAVNANIKRNSLDIAEINGKIDAIIKRVKEAFEELANNHVNAEGGISAMQNIIKELRIQIGYCLGEMRAERLDLVKDKDDKKEELDIILNDLEGATGIFDGRRRDRLMREITSIVDEYNILRKDVVRHEAAISVYVTLDQYFDSKETMFNNISDRLIAVKEYYKDKIAQLQNGVKNEGCIFQINLALQDARSLAIDSADISVSEFIDSLRRQNLDIVSLTLKESSDIREALEKYTGGLPMAKQYKTKSVEMVLSQILEDDANKGTRVMKDILERAMHKSQVLLQYRHRGHLPKEPIVNIMYVGVENHLSSVLATDDLLKKAMPVARAHEHRDVSFVSTGMKDKVLIYSQIGVVPAYTIEGLAEYEEKYYAYDNSGEIRGFHFDADILNDMNSSNYSLQPSTSKIDDGDMLSVWVKGLVYGLIKNEKGTYYVKSKANGKALDEYWVSLKSTWRNQAYDNFKTYGRQIIAEFESCFSETNSQKGEEAIRALFADVKKSYYDKYSQVNISRETLRGPAYKDVQNLLESELQYVDKIEL